jgi:hypothetical protein
MPRYFFHTRDGEETIVDDDGVEFDSIAAAKAEAARGLADMARDLLPLCEARDLAVEVQDEQRNPLFRTSLKFRIEAP